MYDATVPLAVSGQATDRRPMIVHGTGEGEAEIPSLSDIDVDAVISLASPIPPLNDENVSPSAAGRTFKDGNFVSLPAQHPGRVFRMPPPRKVPYQFRLLQQWEGTVTAIGEDDFTAELRDLTDPRRPREEAVFDIEEISLGDRPLFVLGSVFRWSIGYRTSIEGQRERVSHFRFVRIPGWRKSAIADMERRAAALQDSFSASE